MGKYVKYGYDVGHDIVSYPFVLGNMSNLVLLGMFPNLILGYWSFPAYLVLWLKPLSKFAKP